MTRTRQPWVAGGAAAGGLASALVAVFASLCCVSPVIILVLGASGAVAAASLGPYRLPLLIVSGALLGFGYWQTFRRPTTSAVSCPPRVGRWIRVSLSIAAVAWIAAATLWLVQR
ncbi:MAG TPA: mercuric transporter MerT family protein [Gemmatimonadaceae bacterium]|jgi:hypothetical protein|nr:mercuric transporter MerT family protein [Gemmatimonadaceae bacterium]